MSDVMPFPTILPVSPLDLVLRAMRWWSDRWRSLQPTRIGDPFTAGFLAANDSMMACAVAAAPYQHPRWKDGVGWTGPLPAPDELEDFPVAAVEATRAYQRAVRGGSRFLAEHPGDDPPPEAA